MPIVRMFTTPIVGGVGGLADGVAVTGTGTYYGALVNQNGADGMSVHFIWTGTPTGALTLWGSNKPNPSLTDDADWVAVTESWTDPAGSASKGGYELSMRYAAWRVKYVNASGSGVLYGYAFVPRFV